MNRELNENTKKLYEKDANIKEYMKLVYRIARRLQEYIPQEMPWDDVIQYGCVGLVQALKNFEAGKGKFCYFAGFYIYGNIIDGIFLFFSSYFPLFLQCFSAFQALSQLSQDSSVHQIHPFDLHTLFFRIHAPAFMPIIISFNQFLLFQG